MTISRYRDALQRLRVVCRQKGISVRFIHDFRTRDYAGMNSEAAKDMGYKMPKNTIYIDKNLSYKAKYHTLKHELDEMTDMRKGASYWAAHRKALKTEKILV